MVNIPEMSAGVEVDHFLQGAAKAVTNVRGEPSAMQEDGEVEMLVSKKHSGRKEYLDRRQTFLSASQE